MEMLRASLISLALLVGGGSVAFAEDPMPPSEGSTAQAAPKTTAEATTAPKSDAKPAKHHHKNKARNKKPAAKKHKHHAKKAK